MAPENLAAPPQFHALPAAFSFARESQPITPETLVILATFGYKAGRTTNALEGWKGIVQNCEENEKPVLAYAVLEDKEDNMIRTVQVYENAEFVGGDHLTSEAVKKNQEQNGADRDGRMSIVKLKVIAGFLSRD